MPKQEQDKLTPLAGWERKRPCKWCGQEFYPEWPGQKYCCYYCLGKDC